MYQEILDNIKRIIEERGYKKKIIADKVNLTENQFSAMLNGRRAIKLDDIVHLCTVLEITPNELLNWSFKKTA